jgi:hypothetical protein
MQQDFRVAHVVEHLGSASQFCVLVVVLVRSNSLSHETQRCARPFQLLAGSMDFRCAGSAAGELRERSDNVTAKQADSLGSGMVR